MKKESIFKLIGGAALGAATIGVYKTLLKPWHLRWGATDEEVAQAMPGDELIESPVMSATRAITIEARSSEVWPWLLQMGYGRAGFYSYDFIDNSRRRSAERVVPELQYLKVGDAIPLSPQEGLIVEKIEPEQLLLLVQREEKSNLSLALQLNEDEDGNTRMIVRLRLDYRWGIRRSLFYQLFEPGDFVMMRKMMQGIKRRAEALHSEALLLAAQSKSAAANIG